MGDDEITPVWWLGEDWTEREQKEINFARAYAQHYAHGTDGHSRLMLISKLCDKLDAMERELVTLKRI